MVIPVHFSWSSGDSRRMPSSRSPFPSPALRVPLRYGSEMRLDGIRKASSPLMSFPLPLPSLERSEGQRTEVAKEWAAIWWAEERGRNGNDNNHHIAALRGACWEGWDQPFPFHPFQSWFVRLFLSHLLRNGPAGVVEEEWSSEATWRAERNHQIHGGGDEEHFIIKWIKILININKL